MQIIAIAQTFPKAVRHRSTQKASPSIRKERSSYSSPLTDIVYEYASDFMVCNIQKDQASRAVLANCKLISALVRVDCKRKTTPSSTLIPQKTIWMIQALCILFGKGRKNLVPHNLRQLRFDGGHSATPRLFILDTTASFSFLEKYKKKFR